MRRLLGLTLLIALTTLCCSKSESGHSKALTERQRDSIIATEKYLPGASVVGKALAVSDSAAARAARMNSQTSALP